MNAFRDLLGFTGKAADVVLLGGAVGKAKRRNKFGDLIDSGDFAGAEELALRSNEPGFAQLAQQRSVISAKQAEAEQKRQQAQFQYIQNSAAFLDSLSPQHQKAYLDLNGQALVEQGVLDEEDLPILYQNVGVPNGFTGLARSAIDPNQQQQNAFEGQKIAETGRSNLATEGLRGAEVGLSQQRLSLDRERFAEFRRQFDATQATGAAKLAGGDEKQQALNTWLTARNGLIGALSETETGPIRGRLPAFSADQQTAEGAIAATAPVLKQIFRVAGEGVFTDRDQALLLEMVPKRTDRPEARIAKIKNIDAIINAKLGLTEDVSPIPLQGPSGQPDLSSLSDAELEAIANGGR